MDAFENGDCDDRPVAEQLASARALIPGGEQLTDDEVVRVLRNLKAGRLAFDGVLGRALPLEAEIAREARSTNRLLTPEIQEVIDGLKFKLDQQRERDRLTTRAEADYLADPAPIMDVQRREYFLVLKLAPDARGNAVAEWPAPPAALTLHVRRVTTHLVAAPWQITKMPGLTTAVDAAMLERSPLHFSYGPAVIVAAGDEFCATYQGDRDPFTIEPLFIKVRSGHCARGSTHAKSCAQAPCSDRCRVARDSATVSCPATWRAS